METNIYHLESPESIADTIAESGEDYFIALGVPATATNDEETEDTFAEALDAFYVALGGVPVEWPKAA